MFELGSFCERGAAGVGWGWVGWGGGEVSRERGGGGGGRGKEGGEGEKERERERKRVKRDGENVCKRLLVARSNVQTKTHPGIITASSFSTIPPSSIAALKRTIAWRTLAYFETRPNIAWTLFFSSSVPTLRLANPFRNSSQS